MRVLFIGDIYGNYGLSYLKENLDELKKKYYPSVIIVNGENIAEGRGITKDIYKELMQLGIHAITMGNWTFSNYQILEILEKDSNIIRPANYKEAPGVGYKVININGKTLLVINLLGRVFMNSNLENPFDVAKKLIDSIDADYKIIDMHAEATSEKVALGLYLDGTVDAVVGTHTHIQTNDDKVLPKGTLYITDVGMTGSKEGVIGVSYDIVIERFLTGYSRKNIVAQGKRQLNGVLLDLKNKKIEKIRIEE